MTSHLGEFEKEFLDRQAGFGPAAWTDHLLIGINHSLARDLDSF
jgi:hypothetical protein